jgi:hypothetical protein
MRHRPVRHQPPAFGVRSIRSIGSMRGERLRGAASYLPLMAIDSMKAPVL